MLLPIRTPKKGLIGMKDACGVCVPSVCGVEWGVIVLRLSTSPQSVQLLEHAANLHKAHLTITALSLHRCKRKIADTCHLAHTQTNTQS